jgi:hypothetical protein
VARLLKALWRILERVPLHPAFLAVNLVLLYASGDVGSIEIPIMF